MRTTSPLACLLTALVALAACRQSPPPPGHDEAVIGTVTYRERIALPPGTILRTLLLDIDAPDVPDFIVARSERTVEVQVPLDFVVAYDPNVIRPEVQYGIAVELVVRGQVWFETPEPVPVLTKGHPARADLVLRRAQ